MKLSYAHAWDKDACEPKSKLLVFFSMTCKMLPPYNLVQGVQTIAEVESESQSAVAQNPRHKHCLNT